MEPQGVEMHWDDFDYHIRLRYRSLHYSKIINCEWKLRQWFVYTQDDKIRKPRKTEPAGSNLISSRHERYRIDIIDELNVQVSNKPKVIFQHNLNYFLMIMWRLPVAVQALQGWHCDYSLELSLLLFALHHDWNPWYNPSARCSQSSNVEFE